MQTTSSNTRWPQWIQAKHLQPLLKPAVEGLTGCACACCKMLLWQESCPVTPYKVCFTPRRCSYWTQLCNSKYSAITTILCTFTFNSLLFCSSSISSLSLSFPSLLHSSQHLPYFAWLYLIEMPWLCFVWGRIQKKYSLVNYIYKKHMIVSPILFVLQLRQHFFKFIWRWVTADVISWCWTWVDHLCDQEKQKEF